MQFEGANIGIFLITQKYFRDKFLQFENLVIGGHLLDYLFGTLRIGIT